MRKIIIQCPDIPLYARKGLSPQKAAAEFLSRAVRENILPAREMAKTKSIQISIDTEVYNTLITSDHANAGSRLGQYIQSVIDLERQSAPTQATADRTVYQEQYYNGIAEGLRKGKIVLAEGATGIGKGRVLARVAKERSESGFGPVVITAPSVNVLKQLIEEWHKAGYPSGGVSCVLGRQQFVDTELLYEILTEENSPVIAVVGQENVEKALRWLESGCPRIKENETTAPLGVIAPSISHMDADLISIVPEMEPFGHLYQLNEHSDPEDPGNQAYTVLRESSIEAEIVFCTHAMVAYDILFQQKQKTRLLPEYRTIIIDEAHLFEAGIANIHSDTVSILGLKNVLNKSAVGSKVARDKCTSLCREVIAVSAAMDLSKNGTSKVYHPSSFDSGSGAMSSSEHSFFRLLGDLESSMGAMLKKSRKKDSRVTYLHSALRKIVSRRHSFLVSNTPVRKWPVLTTGKKSVDKELASIWSQVHGAVLASATLAIPSGKQSANFDWKYMITAANIPPHRVACPLPVTPAWVRDIPRIHLKGPAGTKLNTPSSSNRQTDYEQHEKDVAQWQKDVAEEIGAIAETAVGGTLVLACSYDDIEKIGEHLLPELGDRLILKTRTASLEQQKNQFKEMAREGKRPVWISAGGAWTGLDLRDEKVPDEHASKDIILTDLVVPRVNFADNKTFGKMLVSARTWGGYSSTPTEAAFTLRQGLGRLVRRPGVKHRRLWFLDTRPAIANGATYSAINNVVGVYPNRA